MARILVVEDEFLLADHIGGLLEDDGFEILRRRGRTTKKR
jgi:hypothetical protein